jgi:hypothetical protein
MVAPVFDPSYHGPDTKGSPVACRFLRQLNMGTLACAMFVALALLSNTQGKDAGPGVLSAPRAAKTQIAIDNVNLSPHTIATNKDFGNKIEPRQ